MALDDIFFDLNMSHMIANSDQFNNALLFESNTLQANEPDAAKLFMLG
jgi:hypothetical protein